MAYLGSWEIGDQLIFGANLHHPTGASAVDHDANGSPIWRIYEDNASPDIASGNLYQLHGACTIGFYSSCISLTAGNGFEQGKNYYIYMAASVASTTGTMHHTFQMGSEVRVASMADNVLTANAINASAFTNAKFAADFLTNSLVADNTIAAENIATDAITAAKIASNAITSDEIANNAITAAKINASAISACKLAANALHAAAINASAFSNAKFAADYLTNSLIGDNAIAVENIANNAITAAKINASAISACKLAANALHAAAINASAFSNAKFAADYLTNSLIADNAIAAENIATDAITAAKIAANAITSSEIADNAITADKIAASAITNSEFADSAASQISDKVWADNIYAFTGGSAAAKALSGLVPVMGEVVTSTCNSGSLFGTDLGENSASHYNGKVIVFTSGSNVGLSRIISDFTDGDAASTPVYVVPDVPNTPQNGDRFVILGMHAPLQPTDTNNPRVDVTAGGNVGVDFDNVAGTLDASEIGASAITNAKVADGLIIDSTFGNNAITAAKINASALTNAKFGADFLSNSLIEDNAIAAEQLAANAITAAKINASAISACKIAANAIDAAGIAASALANDAFAADFLTNSLIADNAIGPEHVAASTIVASTFDAGAIDNAAVADNFITAAKINASALTNAKFGADFLSNSLIEDNAIAAEQIATDAITAAKIAASAITNSEIADGLIIDSTFGAGAIDSAALDTSAASEIANSVWGDNIYAYTGASAAGRALRGIVPIMGAVVTSTCNSGSLFGTDLNENTASHFNGQTVVFLSGSNVGHARTIADFTDGDGASTPVWVSRDLPDTPQNGDLFAILGVRGGLEATDYFIDNVDVNSSGNVGIDLDNTTGTLDAAEIGASALTNAKFAADFLTNSLIADDTLNTEQFANNALTAAKISASAIAASKIAAGAFVHATAASEFINRIVDVAWRRSASLIENSDDGDNLTFRSPYGAVAKLVHRFDASDGATASVFQNNDSTVLGTQTMTACNNASPIVQLNTD